MNDKRQTTDTDEELIDILTAISVVSKRLARNLTIYRLQSDICMYKKPKHRLKERRQTLWQTHLNSGTT